MWLPHLHLSRGTLVCLGTPLGNYPVSLTPFMLSLSIKDGDVSAKHFFQGAANVFIIVFNASNDLHYDGKAKSVARR